MTTTEQRTNPWYVLGAKFDTRYTVDEALEMVKGDDFVTPADLYTIEKMTPFALPIGDGGEPEEGFWIAAKDLEEVEGSIGIKSDLYGTMSTQSPAYEITQRREVLNLAYEISGFSGEEALVQSVGHMGPRAQRFFAYLELPHLVIDPYGIADEIVRGMYVATSFDGSIATTIGESDLRPSCTNMIHMALRGLERPIKVHHRRNAEERLRAAAKAWEYAGAVEQEKLKKCEAMLDIPGIKAINALNNNFWPVDDPDLPASTRTKRETARSTIRTLYEQEREKVGKNGYAAYQAFTEYQDHYRPVRVSRGGGTEVARRAENAVMPGPVVTNKIKASNIITALAA